jgi:excisionase family DNA binding protein
VLDDALRKLLEDVVRRVVREEIASLTKDFDRRGDEDLDGYMSVRAVSRLLQVSTNTVRTWIAKGLPEHRLGRIVRIKRSDLDAFLLVHEQHETGPDPDEHAAEILARRERR